MVWSDCSEGNKFSEWIQLQSGHWNTFNASDKGEYPDRTEPCALKWCSQVQGLPKIKEGTLESAQSMTVEMLKIKIPWVYLTNIFRSILERTINRAFLTNIPALTMMHCGFDFWYLINSCQEKQTLFGSPSKHFYHGEIYYFLLKWSWPGGGCQEARVPLCTSWWSSTGSRSPGSLWKCFFQPPQWCSSWAGSWEDLVGPMERGTHREDREKTRIISRRCRTQAVEFWE